MSKRNSSGKLRSLLSKTFTKRKRQRERTCRFEQLEARRVLAVAIWNNAVTPLNVNGDPGGFVAPNDVLAIVNELNSKRFADPAGRLPKDVDPTLNPFFYDVNCDGFISPIDALGVINYLNSGADPQPGGVSAHGGTWANASCSPQLIEGDGFATELTRRLTLPDDSSAIKVLFQAPEFDTSSEGVRDAFEIEVTDTDGNPIAFAYQPNRDASYNWSEGQGVVFGPGVQTITEPAGQDSSATIYLAGMEAGTEVIVRTRLVNNDGDDTTSVIVRGFEVIDSDTVPPAGRAGFASRPVGVERPEWDKLTDLTSSLVPQYGRTSLAGDNTELLTELAVTNQGRSAVLGRVIVVVENMSDIDAAPMGPDGFTPDGDPYFDLTHEMDSQPLAPGDTIRSRELRFLNTSGARFRYNLRTLGDVNRTPTSFTSTPGSSIESGRTYRYAAVATDPDGQPLSFSIVAGPQAATMDSETGVLSWATTSEDVGLQRIVLRATDTHGLYVEQAFSVEVKEVQQNRPPIFTSDPVTEAIASSGFEVTTVGVGASPAGAAVISGFRGPRIVTANSADQTIGVYAGENNDRFDDATSYSTGFPTAGGQLFDVGYSIDVGLPEFTSTADGNSVKGMDQGDLNGDGILDLVVMTSYDVASTGARYQLVINALLGDGNGNFSAPQELYRHTYSTYTFDPRNLVLRDFNNDGALDVLATEQQRDPRLISILGNGDGTFDTAVEQTFEGKILSDFHTADIDEDGFLDLIGRIGASGPFGANYKAVWLKGLGDGAFSEPNVIGPAGFSYRNNPTRAHDVLDLNADGNLDFVFIENNNVTIYHSDGDGNFALASEFRHTSISTEDWIRGADFSGDGIVDLLHVDGFNGQLELLVGTGDGINFTRQTGINVDTPVGNYAGSDDPMDIDGDGDLDLIFGDGFAFENSQTAMRVAINDGSGKFTITEFAMVDFTNNSDVERFNSVYKPRGGMFGDYNSDGVVDFSYFTSSSDFDGVGIRLGTKPGEFGRSRAFPWTPNTRGQDATPGDFNGDGAVDLIDARNDRIALGNGDGTFGETFAATGLLGSGYASVADFNLDGIDDFVAARSNRYYVALANGDGTFAVSDDQLVESSFYGYSSTESVDFNNDGYPDLVAKAGVETHIDVHLNDPDDPGVFTRTFRITLPAGSQGINVSNWQESYAVADFTGDGILDLAFAERDNSTDQKIKLVLMAGDGLGDFTRHSELAGFDSFTAVNGAQFYAPGDFSAGDLDSDGDVDLISATNHGARIFLNDGTGSFQFLTHLENPGVQQRGRDSWLVDFNADGHLDFVQTGSNGYGPLVLRLGNGDATFQPGEQLGIAGGVPGIISRQPFADLDADGHLDFVHASAGIGNSAFDTASIYAQRRDDLVDLVAVDLNGDGNEEVLAINDQMERLQIYQGDNLGAFTRLPDLQTGSSPKAVAVGDLDGDGQAEIVVANQASSSLMVYVGNLADGFSATEVSTAGRVSDIAVADINGDGRDDVVALDTQRSGLLRFLSDGTTTLTTPTEFAVGDVPGRLSLGDANGDGTVDAIVTLPVSDRLMIINDIAADTLSAPIFIPLDGQPQEALVLELNDDGNPDIAVTLPSSDSLAIYYGLGNDQFTRPQSIQVGSGPERLVVTDADEDGRLDLVVTNAGDDTVSVIYNRFDPNEVYRYDADAIDPDDDPLTYSIADGPGGLIINRDTGALLWAASPDQVGVHDVTIAADDGRGGVATQSFKIEVEPSRENSAPLIATLPETKIGAGETFEYHASAIDADNNTLRYRLLAGPDGATIDPVTGELKWDGATDGAVSINRYAGTHGDIRTYVGDSGSLALNNLTIEGWFNTQKLTSGVRDTLIYFGDSSLAMIELSYFGESEIRLNLYNGASSTVRFSVPFDVEVDRWRHFAVAIDDANGSFDLFIDGRSVLSDELPGSFIFSEGSRLDLGAGFGSYSGLVDNFRVWNRARSAAEVQEGLSRQYDGDPSLMLDYRFEDEDTRMVRDRSGNANDGYYVASQSSPITVAGGLADTGMHTFVVGVEDGRGGFDEQSFALEIVAELRGSIVGHLFNDLNGDGDQDDGSETGVPEEPNLESWHLWIDSNGNAYPDPHEPQTTTDTDGNYRFDRLLPGEYPIRVSPVAGYDVPVEPTLQSVMANTESTFDLAIEQMALSQVRGTLQTEDGDAISYWKAYVDLDGDGQRGEDEPVAMSDRDGNFALTGLDAGTYTIRPDVPAGWTDSAGSDGLSVTLGTDEVSEGNNFTLAPTSTSVTGGVHFVTMPPGLVGNHVEVEARQTFSYASIALGIGEPSITYDLSLAPEGMTLDPTTGLVAWRPSIAQVGEHLVVLRATAADGSIALHDFYLTVTAPNTAPILSGIGFQPVNPPTAYAGLTYVLNLSAQDAELDNITFTLRNGPDGASLDPTTGELRWVPAASAVGSQEFSVELKDSVGNTSTFNFTAPVLDQQPTATPFDITPIRSEVGLGQDYFALLRGKDALGRPLTWSLVGGPDGLALGPNNSLRWTPGNAQLGERTFELEAANPDGDTEQHSLTVQVVGRPVNSSPSITSMPILSATIDQVFAYDIAADDADLDVLAYALLDGPVGMSVHPSDGTLRWTPAADQCGEHSVTLQVTDPDGETDEQTFEVAVSRFGGPPRITSIPPSETAVGVGYLYTVRANDAEGDPLTYRLLAAPAGMTIVEATGEITWTPTSEQLGEQDVAIEVSDGVGGAATQAMRVLVADGVANLPPGIESSAPRFTSVGETYRYDIVALDPEGQQITFSLGQSPDGMAIDAVSGELSWTPSSNQAGQHVVTIIATDEGGATAIESYQLDVVAENSPPAILGEAPTTSVAGAAFRYDLMARDEDRDALTFSLSEAPVGAEIDAFGRLTWQPSNDDIGTHGFEVIVRDSRGGEAMQSFTLDIVADTEGPRVSLIETPNDASRNVLPWQGPFVAFARAIDNVGVASLTLSANGQDIPLDASGTATFNFDDWFFDTIDATAIATDVNGNTTIRSISFNYDVPEGWSTNPGPEVPTAIISSPADNGTAFGMVSITGTADHENFGAYTLSYRHVDETSFTEIVRSTDPVVDGELGVWDTSLLLNDEYVIRLQVATTEGTANVVEHSVGLSGELKLGNFSLSFTDMVIPVAGIPIEITRIYDTLQADRQGDFGYGWRLEYRNTDLRVGLPKSGLEDIGIYTPLRPGVKVYLNVPGEGRQGFTFNPDIRVLPGFGGQNLVLARPRFTPDPGVTSTLGTGTSSYLQVNELGQLYAPGGIPYNPASPDFGGAYVLTTREGATYRIDGTTGDLMSASDLVGNELSFSANGIVSTKTNFRVDIERNASGHITSIVHGEDIRFDYQYNAVNRLSKTVDTLGVETTFTYQDASPNRLEEVLNVNGNTGTRQIYDEQGRIVEQIDAAGNRIARSYDPANSIVSSFDADGNESQAEYDNFGNLLSETNSLGLTRQYAYDANGNRTREVDENENVTSYAFDVYGNITATTYADGTILRSTFDGYNSPTAIVDQLGDTTVIDRISSDEFEIRSDGIGTTRYQTDLFREEKSFQIEGRVDTITHRNENGLVTNWRDILGNEWVATWGADLRSRSGALVGESGELTGIRFQESFDASGNLVSFQDITGVRRDFSYDSSGRLIGEVGDEGFSVAAERNEYGDVTRVEFADGSIIEYGYDNLRNLVSVTDENGYVTTSTYDAIGRITAESFPDTEDAPPATSRVEYVYDAVGNVVEETDSEGNSTRYRYDNLNRLIETQFPDGAITKLEYDSVGNVVQATDERGNLTRFTNDEAGRILEARHPDGTTESWTYNSVGAVTSYTNELGQTRYWLYDKQGRIVESISPGGAKIEYVYDRFDRISAEIGPGSRLVEFEYDERGNVVAEIRNGNVHKEISYDLRNRLSEINSPSRDALSFSYDGLDRVVTQTDGTESLGFVYDGIGNIVNVSSAKGDSVFEYDQQGRLTSAAIPGPADVTYTYNLASTQRTIRSLAGTVTERYGSRGELISVEDPDGNSTAYEYDAALNVISIRRDNGVNEFREYDERNRLVQSVVENSDGEVISRLSLTRNRIGDVVLKRINEEKIHYRYDADRQLIEEIHESPGGEIFRIQYQYDEMFNRTASDDSRFGRTDYVYDAQNRLIQINAPDGVTNLTYDDAGQLILSQSASVTKQYLWDNRGRMVEVQITEDGVSRRITFEYDWEGTLLSRTEAGQTTYFVVDKTKKHPKIIAELETSGDVIQEFQFGRDLLGYTEDGAEYQTITDEQGSILATIDSSGEIVGTKRFDGFGNEVFSEGLHPKNVFFKGEMRDPDLNIDYLRDRYYDPTTGRLLSPDRYDGTVQRLETRVDYVFAENNPIAFSDPSGFATVAIDIQQTTSLIGQLQKGLGILFAQTIRPAAYRAASFLSLQTLQVQLVIYNAAASSVIFAGQWHQFLTQSFAAIPPKGWQAVFGNTSSTIQSGAQTGFGQNPQNSQGGSNFTQGGGGGGAGGGGPQPPKKPWDIQKLAKETLETITELREGWETFLGKTPPPSNPPPFSGPPI